MITRWRYCIDAVMITRGRYCLNAVMLTRWQYCLSSAMITRWHYGIGVIVNITANNFGLQEENINITKPQGKTTN